jgi:hypothetical protein
VDDEDLLEGFLIGAAFVFVIVLLVEYLLQWVLGHDAGMRAGDALGELWVWVVFLGVLRGLVRRPWRSKVGAK